MTERRRAILELVIACAAVAGSALSWSQAHSAVAVPPVADGQPGTWSVVYHPQLVLLTLLLVAVAGVLAIVGTARIRRAQHTTKPPTGGLEPTQP